jgi:hypothetical protein
MVSYTGITETERGVNPSASNPGDRVSEVVWSLSHQRGNKTPKPKQTDKQKKQTKNQNKTKIPSSNGI